MEWGKWGMALQQASAQLVLAKAENTKHLAVPEKKKRWFW